ncbi:MAG: hypothetical protein GX968_01460 [Tissierellia bacterium]|nr:hypothetical protein [Tissierellia bacterium]
MQGMGMYGVIGVLGLILGLAKEILIVIILVQGIRLANIFIKKNKNDDIPPEDKNDTSVYIYEEEENPENQNLDQ